jgi:periplasmic divalent cation tolerance protein
MNNTRSFAVVLVTVPDLKTGRRLARSALRARLAACVNLVPRIESHYWWQGKLEKGAESLMIFKTARRRLAALERHILERHPYDTPEFVVLSLSGGAKRYLDWIADSSTGQAA